MVDEFSDLLTTGLVKGPVELHFWSQSYGRRASCLGDEIAPDLARHDSWSKDSTPSQDVADRDTSCNKHEERVPKGG